MSEAAEYRPRRAHRKSRTGCLPCKTRHVKCDEERPQCNNCLTTDRQCVYAGDGGSNPPKSPGTASAATSTTQDNLLFGLEHMSLLLDAKDRPDLLFMCDEFSQPIISVVLGFALERQHIMDQLLAVCALRRQMTTPPSVTNYLLLNAELQGRALSTHNISDLAVSTDDMLPRFVFGMMLGYSHLGEMYSSIEGTPSGFYGKLREYMCLVKLGKKMARDHWNFIMPSAIRYIYFASGLQPDFPEDVAPQAEQDLAVLDSMLDHSDMDKAGLDICWKAARALKMSYTLFRANSHQEQRRTQAISVFLVYTPVEFVDLLEDSQPEALVILAHYGALMHECREFWAVGDSGRRLVQLASSLLGPHWDANIRSALETVL